MWSIMGWNFRNLSLSLSHTHTHTLFFLVVRKATLFTITHSFVQANLWVVSWFSNNVGEILRWDLIGLQWAILCARCCSRLVDKLIQKKKRNRTHTKKSCVCSKACRKILAWAIRRWSLLVFSNKKCDRVGLVDGGVLKQAASRLMTTIDARLEPVNSAQTLEKAES